MKHERKILEGLKTFAPYNRAEEMIYNKLVSNGWGVTKSGYPDLFCVKNEKIVLIEVKKSKSHKLKQNQQRMLELFSTYGIPCYKWTPDGGFERIKKD